MAPSLAFKAVAVCVTAPSFEMASDLLKKDKLNFDAKQLSRLTESLGERLLKNRVHGTLEGGESLKGKRVFLTCDGGRSRQRKKKRGRKRAGLKRTGYSGDWVEPKLFVILVLKANGQIERQIAPHVDGTLEVEAFMKLLSAYLKPLEIQKAQEVVICGDGAPWIWQRLPELLRQLGVASGSIHESLDYTHAKQNLHELYGKLSKKAQAQVDFSQWKTWLWEGKLGKIEETLLQLGISKKSKAYKKYLSYFKENEKRMHYQEFQNAQRPTGSGVIESAIRRVINLRIKACGSFWKKEKMIIMIYLRAQLLYGRWHCLQQNFCKTI